MEEPTLKGRNRQKVLTLSPTLFSDDVPDIVLRRCPLGERGHHSLSSIFPISTWFVLSSYLRNSLSSFVIDHVERKVVVEERLPLSVSCSLPFFEMPDGSASANVQSGAARCLADPLPPIRVGLTQK
ncbi:hypothetical protein ACFE04_024358 [Oxalis oulophora]